MNRHANSTAIAILAASCCFAVAGCDSGPIPLPADYTIPATTVIRSSVPTPRAWFGPTVAEAFQLASRLTGWISLPHVMTWWPATGGRPTTSAGNQPWETALLDQFPSRVFLQFDAYSGRTGTLADRLPPALAGGTFATPAVRDAFKTEVLDRVRALDADFICIGMEINAYYENQPDDFSHFVSLFAETRDAIKSERPRAVVFPSFQYERLLGRAVKGPHDPHWHLLTAFEPHQDAVGISSYPLADGNVVRFGDPDDLSDDYYAQIAHHTDRPIVFAELGFSTDPRFGGSESAQAGFLRRFETMTADLDLLLVNHFFLYDTVGFGPVFDSMGLVDGFGRPKQAFHVWQRMWSVNP